MSHLLTKSVMIISRISRPVICLAFASFCLPAFASSLVQVDWLTLENPGNPNQIRLLDRNNQLVASALLNVSSGLSFPDFPKQTELGTDSWESPTGFENVKTMNETITGLSIRVIPQLGLASYELTIDVPRNRELILAVGHLYRDADASTQGVVFSVVSDLGLHSVDLLNQFSWDNGAQALDQPLVWNVTNQELTTSAGSEGESNIAFLQVPSLLGSNPQVKLSVPSGYPFGAGDSIFIGIGVVIPEPSTTSILGLATILGLCRRKRRC
jgi:hypothetical protein